MLIIFKDGQTLDVQTISVADGALHIKTLNSTYARLKNLFTDATVMAKIEVPDKLGEVYENYTVFSCIRESSGGVFDVEMLQNGADVNARLAGLENEKDELKKQNDLLTGCILEMSEEVYQ